MPQLRRLVCTASRCGLLVLVAAIAVTSAVAAQSAKHGGSGFVITSDGYVLTAYHVVEDATGPITVTLPSGAKHEARVVAFSETIEDGGNDIALLKIAATGLRTIPLDTTTQPQLFDPVVVLGYPLSFQLGAALTVTGGNVTASHQPEKGPKLIQIDAAVNSGNSGGPLVSRAGCAIGIVVSKLVGVDIEGVSFAVPVQDAVSLITPHVPGWSAASPGPSMDQQQVVAQVGPAVVYIEWSETYLSNGRYEEDFSREKGWFEDYWKAAGYIEVPGKEMRCIGVNCPCEAVGPHFEVDILFFSGDLVRTAAGIAFYPADETSWGFLILIAPDQTYTFFKIAPDGNTWTQNRNWAFSRNIKEGLGVVNHLQVDVGSIALIYINGQLLTSFNASVPLGGHIAMSVVSWKGTPSVRFDNLRIYSDDGESGSDMTE